MQPAIYNYLRQNPELHQFVRFNPVWYRYLTKDPQRMQDLEKASKQFHGQTFSQQVNRIENQLQNANMLIHLAQALKE
ncbi:YlbE-like family protein [Barrientosiimonas marina]|uniref:YlbE-like family protein n=1 Tax=Lentibacillus kimchii TaxID=1542911 RepID=A0ABW2UTR7_9BACI